MANRLVLENDNYGNRTSGLCWAACVATTVRYLTETSQLEAYQVANAMGKNYDKGANVYEVLSAMGLYGCNGGYNIKAPVCSFFEVQHNINNTFPIIAGGQSTINGSSIGHMITIVGYKISGNEQILFYWDPKDGTVSVMAYLGVNTKFITSSRTFKWITTILQTL